MARLAKACACVAILFLGGVGRVDAQVTNGTITGIARDATGGVLPGVTVEVASPVLIEKVRTAVTDGSGQYRIIELRPGTYTVTFTLTGFTTVRQEGIQLAAGFTATVNSDLKVGEVSETITVSGQAPVVDVQNTRTTAVVSRQVLDTLPLGGEYQNVINLLPGTMGSRGSGNDVGGQLGQTFGTMAIHGGSSWDQMVMVDGHRLDSGNSRGNTTFQVSDSNYEEFVVDLGGQTAETPYGGVRINLVPRDGSNSYKGTFFANFTNGRFAASNIDDGLRAKGLRDPNTVDKLFRLTPTFGGPLVQDVVWFYATYTHQTTNSVIAGSYHSLPNTYPLWAPDFSRKSVDEFFAHDATGRVTWNVTPRNKVSGYYDYNYNCHCVWVASAVGGAAISPEAAAHMPTESHVIQATWTSPITSRLLFQASMMEMPYTTRNQPQAGTENVIRIQDQNIAGVGPKQYGSFANYNDSINDKHSIRGSVAYVTGSHAVKTGVDFYRHTNTRPSNRPFDFVYQALNGRPTAVIYQATPFTDVGKLFAEVGVFAQDQWTFQRMTLNYGGRFDFLRQGWPDIALPATRLIPADRVFPKTLMANFRDLSPRVGFAYDVFGNGRTALKAGANRYVGIGLTGFQRIFGGAGALGTDTRSWNDANRNWIVDANPLSPAANGELGPRTNGRFTEARFPRRFDQDYVNGWGTRPATNWEFSGGLQQQLWQGVGLNFGYYDRLQRTFEVIENVAVTPADFDTYCVTTPTDPRLPGGGGQRVCGFFDLKPGAVGRTDPVVTGGDKFQGGQTESWRGFDVTLDARLPGGALLQGGISTGKTKNNNCAYKDTPNVTWVSSLLNQIADAAAGAAGTAGAGSTNPGGLPTTFCALETPFLTQFKMLGSYTLPWQVKISGSVTSVPGPTIFANAVYTSAQVAQSLGRPLSGASTVQLGILPPHTLYAPRRSQVDLRFSRSFKFGERRIEGIVDLFNALNANTLTSVNNTYGAVTGTPSTSWQIPTGIMAPRLVKLGVQMYF